MKRWLAVVLLAVSLAFCGCALLDVAAKVGATVAVVTGVMTPEQAKSSFRVVSAVGKALETFTPENEHYMGRAVTALVLNKFRACDNEAANRYLNVLGHTLTLFSNKPETFKGYHFLVLDTDEVNAFAAPGGFILVSRGLIRCCRTEDALAAVLAHEIAHIELEHGVKAVESGRRTSALATIGVEAARNFGGQDLKKMVSVFDGSMADIMKKLMLEGYSREQELAADALAVSILDRAGYHPGALRRVLDEVGKVTAPTDTWGFGKTHPTVAVRISTIEPLVKADIVKPVVPARQARFAQAIRGI